MPPPRQLNFDHSLIEWRKAQAGKRDLGPKLAGKRDFRVKISRLTGFRVKISRETGFGTIFILSAGGNTFRVRKFYLPLNFSKKSFTPPEFPPKKSLTPTPEFFNKMAHDMFNFNQK